MQQLLVDVAHLSLNKLIMNNKIFITIIFTSFLTSQVYADSQPTGLAFNVIKRNENFKNKNAYPFLHKWNDIKTEQLLSKIEQYAKLHQNDGPLRSDKDKNYKSWHVRQIIYHSSSCLDKAIFDRPGVPNSPFTEDYARRIEKIHSFMNLKEDTFATPNERVFNQFCSTVLEANFESGYCEKPKITTLALDMRLDFAVHNAINITTKTKSLQSNIPIKCALTNNSIEMLEIYPAKASYTILKPFSIQNMQTPQGIKALNVGHATVVLPDALDSSGKPIFWNTDIVQHQVP